MRAEITTNVKNCKLYQQSKNNTIFEIYLKQYSNNTSQSTIEKPNSTTPVSHDATTYQFSFISGTESANASGRPRNSPGIANAVLCKSALSTVLLFRVYLRRHCLSDYRVLFCFHYRAVSQQARNAFPMQRETRTLSSAI